ncbi:MAG: NAD(P)-dependent alcohol dehydrogenase [Archangium sp.]|nr:NAD(P)-dependent alcohol dehydrogenase [Archangium sp.]
MRALQYDAYGGIEKLQLRQAPEPRTSGPLVRVSVAALNPKDALFRKGKFRQLSGRHFPKSCGVDFAGQIERDSGDFRAGDLVFGALQEWTFSRGSLADLVAPEPGELARVPEGVDPAHAASLALVGLTALQAFRDVARMKTGAKVLINGASGGVGTASVQIARLLGAEVTTVSSEGTHALCRELGAHHAAGYAQLDEFSRSGRFDVVFDVFGNLDFTRMRGALAPRGVFVSTVPSVARVFRDVFTRWSKQQERLVVVKPRRADLEQLAGWLAKRDLRAVIDSQFALEDYAAAFARLESKKAHGKILITVA